MVKEGRQIGPCSPFFIVSNVTEAVAFYVQKLRFEARLKTPEDCPIFAIIGRGSAQIMLKSIDKCVPPLPNASRHEWARWDAFIYVDDPDCLAKEFDGYGALFNSPLANTEDGLRGFEIEDCDGYVCFFGRPQ